MALEVKNGNDAIRFCEGRSFGAHRSVAGELVFQTGMVGYPESITDPSYRGQILVITFPLVGNYGVPSREDRDAILRDLPAHFESAQIHIAGLIVASYCGEDYSHHLAKSSLGQWLKEQNIPALCDVDTRALTKKIREKGSMLGRLLIQTGTKRILCSGPTHSGAMTPNGTASPVATPGVNLGAVNNALAPAGQSNGNGGYFSRSKEVAVYDEIDWYDPNTKNLVAEGKLAESSFLDCSDSMQNLIASQSPSPSPRCIHPVRPLRCIILLVDPFVLSVSMSVSSTTNCDALSTAVSKFKSFLGITIFPSWLARSTTACSSLTVLVTLPW